MKHLFLHWSSFLLLLANCFSFECSGIECESDASTMRISITYRSCNTMLRADWLQHITLNAISICLLYLFSNATPLYWNERWKNLAAWKLQMKEKNLSNLINFRNVWSAERVACPLRKSIDWKEILTIVEADSIERRQTKFTLCYLFLSSL